MLSYANPELRKTRRHPEFNTRRVVYSALLLSVVVGVREKIGPTLEGLNLGEVSEVAIA